LPLPQPGLGLVVSGHVVEGARRLDELEPPRGLLLDQLLLAFRQVVGGDPLASFEGAPQKRPDRHPGQAHQLLRQRLPRDLARLVEALGVSRLVVHERQDLAARGQRDVDLRAVGALHEDPVEVREVLGDEHRRRRSAHGRIRAPVQDLDQRLAEVGEVQRVSLGGDELRVVEHDRDLEG